jgi:hypothetical protein
MFIMFGFEWGFPWFFNGLKIAGLLVVIIYRLRFYPARTASTCVRILFFGFFVIILPVHKQPTASPKNFWIASLCTLILCILFGLIVRQLAIAWQQEFLAEISNGLLFLPMSVTTLWIAWNLSQPPKIRWIEPILVAMLLSVSCTSRFLIATASSLSGPSNPEFVSPRTFWFAVQVAHWLCFLVVGVTIAKSIQWFTGVGIWPTRAPSRKPASLSIAKIGLLVTLIAMASLAYQRWFQSWSNGILAIEDPPAWYEFFPHGSKPWATGLVGGLLVPIHWLAITAILNHNYSSCLAKLTLRSVYLATWMLVAAVLQGACSKLYFWNPIMIMPSLENWIRYSIGQPYVPLANYAMPEPPLAFYLFKSLLQIGLVLIAIGWITRRGYRIGFYGSRSAKADLEQPIS